MQTMIPQPPPAETSAPIAAYEKWAANNLPNAYTAFRFATAISLPLRPYIPVVFGLLLLTSIECRILGELYPLNDWLEAKWQWGGQVVQMIHNGQPEARVFQNRLLGPTIVHYVSKTQGGDYQQAFILVMYAFLFASNSLLFWYASLRHVSRTQTWTLLALNASLVILCCDRTNNFSWDWVDTVTLSIFAMIVLENCRPYWFLLLFLVEITNRESALFIPCFLFARAATLLIAERRLSRRGAADLFGAVAMLAIGITYTAWTRAQYVGPVGETRTVGSQFWQLPYNWNVYAFHFPNPDSMIPLLLYAGAIWATCRLGATSRCVSAACLLITAMFAANQMFGWVNELRISLVLVPFVTVPLIVSAGRSSHRWER